MTYSEYTLEQLGSVGRGRSRHRPRNDQKLFGGPYPFIQTGEVKEANLYITKHEQTYNEFGLAQSKLWNKGTLLITIAANIAESAILSFPACFPDSIVGFIADKEKTSEQFIKYYIDYLKLEMQSASRGTTQDNLSVDKLLTFKFRIPDRTIQRSIESILVNLDEAILTNKQRIDRLEQIMQLLYKEWFVNFKFPEHEKVKMFDSGHPDFGIIPAGWTLKKLSDISEIVTGRTPSKANSMFYANNYLFVKTPDMHGNTFIWDTEEMLSSEGHLNQGNKRLEKDSILVSCIGTIGVVSISSTECSSNQQINAITNYDRNYREFLFLWAKTLKQRLEALGSNGATMGNVNKTKFEQLLLVQPSLKIAEKFHNLIEPMISMIGILERANKKLSQIRDLLLPKLISGEIDVSELSNNYIENLTAKKSNKTSTERTRL